MKSVEEAIALIENSEVETKTISVNIKDSLNYVLSEDIFSQINMPSFPQSAMDGYAVYGDYQEFELIDEVQAGDTRNISLKDGQACRIFTGAAVPFEATAVIMQEKTKQTESTVIIEDEIVFGKNIRPIGEQIKEKDLIFNKGQKLNAAALGLLQTLGIEKVSVYKNPKISLLVTGDELKPLGTELKHGEIFESNSITIMSAAKQSGFIIEEFNHIVDNFENTKKSIETALNESDVVILSGGISVGDYDFVGKALKENGVEEVFYKIKQKPGKPLFFGKKGDKYVFALPGNPAAALTCYYIYVLPMLRKIKGETNTMLASYEAEISHSYIKKAKRATFLKGKLGNNKVQVLDGQSSAMLHSYALANCLVYLPEDKFDVSEGEMVKVYLLPQ